MGQPDQRSNNSSGFAAAAMREERRRTRRTKLALRARLQPYNPTTHIPEEIRLTVNVSRGGFYFTTKRPSYAVHLHLYVACPYSGFPMDRDRELARVVRVEPRSNGEWGVAALFVRSTSYHPGPAEYSSVTKEVER